MNSKKIRTISPSKPSVFSDFYLKTGWIVFIFRFLVGSLRVLVDNDAAGTFLDFRYALGPTTEIPPLSAIIYTFAFLVLLRKYISPTSTLTRQFVYNNGKKLIVIAISTFFIEFVIRFIIAGLLFVFVFSTAGW